MVSSRRRRLGAFTKRDFHRRINVAASRARDQMWLFHSVQPGDLHADDARALLLSYALRPASRRAAGRRRSSAAKTDFQRAVLRRLVDARAPARCRSSGSARYRIDFVLNAPDGRRLAIECDGDRYHGAESFAQDLRRQAILERVGNCVFVRLRASLFARDPDAAMAPVWQRAEELGLSPPDSHDTTNSLYYKQFVVPVWVVELIGRARELAELDAAWAMASGGEPQLAVLWGRRRVGKTYLLTHLAGGKRASTSPPPGRTARIASCAGSPSGSGAARRRGARPGPGELPRLGGGAAVRDPVEPSPRRSSWSSTRRPG